MEGKLHVYHPGRNLLLFEHIPRSSSSLSSDKQQSSPQLSNTLLFVGGMYDNFLLPNYTIDLSSLFPRHTTQTWSLMHIQLSSASRSFGTSSLSKDIDEIATAITYIRTHLRPYKPSNIVLIGHSTGCQDLLTYLYATNPPAANRQTRPAVQGAILQAPASDRDMALETINTDSNAKALYDSALTMANSTPEPKHNSTILPLHLTTPLFGPAPLSISRFLSLASPNSPQAPGPDDLFSSDGTTEHLASTFGQIGHTQLLQPSKPTPPTILTLMGALDEFVPSHIDKESVLQRWRAAMDGSGASMHQDSGIIADGIHDLSGDDAASSKARMVDFRTRVLRYLDDVVGGVDESAWAVVRDDEKEIERRSGEDDGHGQSIAVADDVEKGVGNLKL